MIAVPIAWRAGVEPGGLDPGEMSPRGAHRKELFPGDPRGASEMPRGDAAARCQDGAEAWHAGERT